MTNSTSQEFFEALYQANEDPWHFADSAYEQQRYAAMFDALGHRPYGRAFEPGCSIGVLTEKLASVCTSVEAIDISPRAVSLCRERCRNLENVTINQGALPESMPRGEFDLIVFSEIGYYFDPSILRQITAGLWSGLSVDGVFLAAHWLGSSKDHRLGGDEVHEILAHVLGSSSKSERHEGFRLDRWTKA